MERTAILKAVEDKEQKNQGVQTVVVYGYSVLCLQDW